MTKKSAVVICPGRGVYNADELGYLTRHHASQGALIAEFDALRQAAGQAAVSELDRAARFSVSRFTRGDNASALIYACSYADYLSIDRSKFEIVAATGNSMGWYTALACGGALNGEDGFHVANTMGAIMQESLIGGQLLHICVDEDWRELPGRRFELSALTREIEDLYVSIHLGGMVVFAGTPKALQALENRLEPAHDRFPMRLSNHAAFHSPLQTPNSERAKDAFRAGLFGQPTAALVDGRGHTWLPNAVNTDALWGYTFGHQITETYDFTAAVVASVREFSPEALIILGPGKTLGGAVAQSLIGIGWRGLTSKADFTELQKTDPYVISMGMEAQRGLVVGG